LTEVVQTYSGAASPFNWAGSLALSAVGTLAVLAGNPYTLMMAWTTIDLVELFLLLGGSQAAQLNQRIVIAFAARLLGTVALLWAVASIPLVGDAFALTGLAPQGGFILLLAAGLRLGVLPLHLPFSQEPRLRRGMGTVLWLAPVASSLVLLARLPSELLPASWSVYLSALVGIAALYSAAKWLAAPDELAGRPYWLVGMAALSIFCVISGNPSASLAWGLALLLPGGLLFLYSARQRVLFFLPVMGLWGLVGLSFSPAASGWQGLLGQGVGFWNILAWFAQILLVLGYARHAFRQGDPISTSERWAAVIYPIGLLLIALMDIVIGIWGWPGSRTTGIWWMGVVTACVLGLAVLIYWRRLEFSARLRLPAVKWLTPILQMVLGFIGEMLRLDWLYRFFWLVFGAIGRLLGAATAILEGDGGVLWALLLLALLVSLVGRGGF
jgi:hypothetical protein